MSQTLDKQYILDVINDKNSLIIRLNELLNDFNINNELMKTLLQIHCNYLDIYVKYISGNVIINNVVNNKTLMNIISCHHCWHCLPQMSKFFNRLSAKVEI